MVCALCKSQANVIMLSPRLSVTHNICLHFNFLVSRPGMGGICSPSISFLFISGHVKCLSREKCAG